MKSISKISLKPCDTIQLYLNQIWRDGAILSNMAAHSYCFLIIFWNNQETRFRICSVRLYHRFNYERCHNQCQKISSTKIKIKNVVRLFHKWRGEGQLKNIIYKDLQLPNLLKGCSYGLSLKFLNSERV